MAQMDNAQAVSRRHRGFSKHVKNFQSELI